MRRISYQFAHTPLRPDSIRLIELLPGKYDDRLECRLSHHVFDDTLLYEGVSYTWGDPGREMSIIVNDAKFYIRRNLFHCLRRLRHNRKSLFLWIDAICIDQSSAIERNHNVGMMDDIFSQASSVYIWLGESDQRTDLAMSFLEHEFQIASVPGYLINPQKRDGWHAISELFNQPYWTRIWVVQEFVLATDIVLVCGGKRLHGTPIVNTTVSMIRVYDAAIGRDATERASTWARNVDILESIRNSHATRLMIYRAQNNLRADSPSSSRRVIYMRPLSALLDNFCLSKCTDSRDYLFAMLSLASDFYSARRRIVDYSLSELDLFRKVIAHYNRIYSGDRGLEYCELKAIAHLYFSFNLRVPERDGHCTVSADINICSKARTINADIKVCIDQNADGMAPNFFQLSPAHLLQKSSQTTGRDLVDSTGIRWNVNVDDDQQISYRDVLSAGESLSRYNPAADDYPKLLICTYNTKSFDGIDSKEFMRGLICSAAREGDLLFTQGFHSHIGLVFRRLKHDENKYIIVGTAICEMISESKLSRQGSLNGEALQLPMMLGESALLAGGFEAEYWMDTLALMKLVQYLRQDITANRVFAKVSYDSDRSW